MKNRKIISKVLIATLLTTLITPIFAGSWNWTRPYKMPEKNIENLIIIGNYRQPRLVADLIQNETKQPILVIPTSGEGDIFFMPADRNDKTLTIKVEDINNFVKFLQPNKILVLGNKKYVPEHYLEHIDSSQTVITVTNKNWASIAKAASRILDLKYLIRDFDAQQKCLNSGKLYRPNSTITTPKTSPILNDDAVIIKDNENIIIEDAKTSTTDDAVILEDNIKNTTIPSENILEEPKLIDETMVVPK